MSMATLTEKINSLQMTVVCGAGRGAGTEGYFSAVVKMII